MIQQPMKRKAKDNCIIIIKNGKKKKLPEEVQEQAVHIMSNDNSQKKILEIDNASTTNNNTLQEAATTISPVIESPLLLTGKSIRIYSWNINGFRAAMRKKSIETFIQKEDPDILCFNETKLNETAIEKNNYSKIFPEYHQYWNCSKKKGGYSGVGIFTKNLPDNVLYGINNEANDSEGRVLTLEYSTFYLISAYIPNSGQYLERLDYRLEEWDPCFMKYLSCLKDNKKDIIVCGDLNVTHQEIDIAEPTKHTKHAGFTIKERNNFTQLLNYGYLDSFRFLSPSKVKYSHFSARRGNKNRDENIGWRCDYFLINKEASQRLVESDILNEYATSDHSPIKLTWNI